MFVEREREREREHLGETAALRDGACSAEGVVRVLSVRVYAYPCRDGKFPHLHAYTREKQTVYACKSWEIREEVLVLVLVLVLGAWLIP